MTKLVLHKSISAVAAATIAITSLAAPAITHAQAITAVPAPSIKILPINKAVLLPGQIFDLRVEVTNVPQGTAGSAVNVIVDSAPLAGYFGKPVAATNVTTSSVELTTRGVAFTKPGTYSVTATFGSVTKSVAYEVIDLTSEFPKAKNVIFFLGDGMAWPMLTIARLTSKGIVEGKYKSRLNMETMDEMGMVTTSGYDAIATDSANSMSAYMTGQKGVVNSMGVYEDNTADPNDDPRVENVADVLRRTRNMAIGIVTTAEVEDATPAAVAAHTRRRGEKQYIADVMFRLQPEVLMGGGSAYFLPKSFTGSSRTDERNLINEFLASDYSVVRSRQEMTGAHTSKLLGLFHPSNMNVYMDREQLKNPDVLGAYTDQPTLVEMTTKAIETLNYSQRAQQNGFFLMVEGASIDKMLHPMDWERAAADTIEFDQAIKVALDYARINTDTLVVVTADHSHSVSVFGTYDTAQGIGVRNAVGVYDAAKFPTYEDKNGDGFPDKWDVSRTLAVGFGNQPDTRDDYVLNPKPIEPTIKDPNFTKDTRYIPNPEKDPLGATQEGNLPFNQSSEVHAVDDVPLFAQGPGARLFHGIHDNTELFFNIMGALGIDGTASAAVSATPTAHEAERRMGLEPRLGLLAAR